LALIGPNGGGKSTLLSIMLSQLKPTSGSVKIYTDKIGFTPQETNNNKNFPINVLDVVLTAFVGKKFFRFSKHHKILAEQKLDLVGILDKKNCRVSELSGGQRQRMLIARAIVNSPDLVLLDEPTSNIDTKGQKEIFELLKTLNETTTLVVVSHDISLLFGYVKKVAYVNRSIKMHTLKNTTEFFCQDDHFCEVELIQKAFGNL